MEVVGISSNGCNTLCYGPAPTLENARQLLGWWRHCLPAHRKFHIPSRMPCNQPLQFIQLLLMVECMGIHSAALCMLTGPDDLCGIKERVKAATNKILPQKSRRIYRGNQFYTSESY
ncbi:hypothetical protein T03_6235 [Trichinella britovi]|uniref:Uncharacterized protein n=1 Tax=Trichinella britovi TaxID=45882 RepID=A0A0V1C9E1_TRIBR|nr:hypothetical protein T03_6235 [Trichinella britovi]